MLFVRIGDADLPLGIGNARDVYRPMLGCSVSGSRLRAQMEAVALIPSADNLTKLPCLFLNGLMPLQMPHLLLT